MGQRVVRNCAQCGTTFKGSARRCDRCRATQRTCRECGEDFTGRGQKCPACYRTERICTGCERRFRGASERCRSCYKSERTCTQCGRIFTGPKPRCGQCRVCVQCGQAFIGIQRRCMACLSTERGCTDCGAIIVGAHQRCIKCRVTERACAGCGREFRSHQRFCEACRSSERPCAGCGQKFTGARRLCSACSLTDRTCAGCSRTFRGKVRICNTCYMRNLPPAERLALRRRKTNMRRARKLGAQIIGPISRKVYAAILAAGPCVYCGTPATSVDHVRPLARGGLEIEANLVPACDRCNSGKRDRLLTEWRPERVARAVACSPIVAAEWAVLTAGGACQVFGDEWLDRVEPDTRPEMLSGDGRVIFQRPRAESGSDEGSGDG